MVNTAGVGVEFPAGATSTFQNLSVTGTAGNEVYLHSGTPGSQWNIHVPGSRSVNYANIKDSDACTSDGNITTSNSTDGGNNDCWSFPIPPSASSTISSAANQTFEVGQTATAISQITVRGGGTDLITGTNDLRIAIATSTIGINMRWDTTDTSATLSGTGAGKACSGASNCTSITYEGSGSVMVVPIDSNFSDGEQLIITDLKFTNFGGSGFATTTHAATTTALRLYLDGPSVNPTSTPKASDTKTVTIKGKTILADHTLGQVPNSLRSGSVTDVFLQFNARNDGETASTTLKLDLSTVSGITSGEITNSKIFADVGGDGIANASTSWTTAFDTSVDEHYSFAFDSKNNVMYAGHENGGDSVGDVLRCDTSTGCDATSDWTVALNGPEDSTYSLAYDSNNNIMYVGQGSLSENSNVYRCDTATGCDANGDWTLVYDGSVERIQSLFFEPENNIVWFGLGGSTPFDTNKSAIYRCDASTGCDEQSDWKLVYDGSMAFLMFFNYDAKNNVMYATDTGDPTSTTGDVLLRCPKPISSRFVHRNR